MAIMTSIYAIIDVKITSIEEMGKRPSVIILNEGLFKQMQQEMLFQDMKQAYGKIRSPHELSVYKGLKVIPSQVCESTEVY